MLYLYLEMIHPIRRALLENQLPTFALNWDHRKKDGRKIFQLDAEGSLGN